MGKAEQFPNQEPPAEATKRKRAGRIGSALLRRREIKELQMLRRLNAPARNPQEWVEPYPANVKRQEELEEKWAVLLAEREARKWLRNNRQANKQKAPLQQPPEASQDELPITTAGLEDIWLPKSFSEKVGDFLRKPTRRQKNVARCVVLGVAALTAADMTYLTMSMHSTQHESQPAVPKSPKPLELRQDRIHPEPLHNSLREIIFSDPKMTVTVGTQLRICGPEMAAQSEYDKGLAALQFSVVRKADLLARSAQETRAAGYLNMARVPCQKNTRDTQDVTLPLTGDLYEEVTTSRADLVSYRANLWQRSDRPYIQDVTEDARRHADTATVRINELYLEIGDKYFGAPDRP